MTAIRLPRVASFRQLAKELVANSAIEAGTNIDVDVRDVVASTSSFIDELVRDLAIRQPASITIVDANPDFIDNARTVADAVKVELLTR